MEKMNKNNLYQHFKGGIYELIGIGTHSETGEEMVIYKSTTNGRIWIRPKNMFYSLVTVKGKITPRFKKIP